jgi:arginyl-tRNA synthetase
MKRVIRSLVKEALKSAKESGDLTLTDFPKVIIEKPKDEKMGDFSTTLAMSLAKSERKKPRDIAETICKQLRNGSDMVESVEIAGPGFINLKMSLDFFYRRLLDVASLKDDFGNSDIGKKLKVHLEFVSANPTGPLHVGHGRGAAVGNALGCLLKKAGYDVYTEYYVNDVGNQMNILGRSTLFRYKELLGESIEFPDDHYQGDYINDIAREIIAKNGNKYLDVDYGEALPFFKKYAADSILDGIKTDLKDFRVEYDNWFSEQSLYDDKSVENSINWLREKGHIYDKDGAVWMSTSTFKDEKDRVLIKSTGEKTYFCSDIAYHKNKIDRGYEKIVDLWGADHHGYVGRMEAVLEAMEYTKEVFNVLLIQFVSLVRGGEKVSMSTRSGEFVTLSDVVEEVGVDAARFFFLMRSSDTHLDFDLELAKKESPDNPVYYIQYAHARICNIFNTAKEQKVELPAANEVDLSLLKEAEEISLIKKILAYPECIETSALKQEVHRIPYYLQELVGTFHPYYAKCRVVTDDKELTIARLFLIDITRGVIKNGLSVLGVSAPERM